METIQTDVAKKAAGEKAVEFVKPGMIVGLGTGTTAYYAIVKLGEMIKEGLDIKAIPTSAGTLQLMHQYGIPQTTFAEVEKIAVTIDGADEVDLDFHMIKGGGGALMREKIVAQASEKVVIAVGENKLVRHLGKFPLPVEVVQFGYEQTQRLLAKLGGPAIIRGAAHAPYITENENYIIDLQLNHINNPIELENQLKSIAGVATTGLFINLANVVVVGREDGSTTILHNMVS
ncbi:ribose-5-phosphate isomerase [Chitinophaga skermanii]|uniref:Ribose-5-phosphate isomerase A n=1 Tax=Chitinophaga skermanii TaxID=331697 RepID=A0A327Q2G2_9BACT|nr:ribose-5-phosphate isomerase RpiA [Chitinophaga skermanii]RAI98655.1 ribose-5-phosphate isomerase [Chitinophaga skermanii]